MTLFDYITLPDLVIAAALVLFVVIGAARGLKLEMVKQAMARVNISILGISELKWAGMGGFNSDDHYISPTQWT